MRLVKFIETFNKYNVDHLIIFIKDLDDKIWEIF